jgi:hypothetical protein
LPRFVADCAVARKYLELLGPLDWEHFPERDPHRPWPGPTPAPRAPFVAAYLVKLHEGKSYMSNLRDYLVSFFLPNSWLISDDLSPEILPYLGRMILY